MLFTCAIIHSDSRKDILDAMADSSFIFGVVVLEELSANGSDGGDEDFFNLVAIFCCAIRLQ